MKKLVFALILAAAVLVPTASAATALSGAKAALADRDLTLADMLTYALQDERIARAEYQVMLDTFGSSVHSRTSSRRRNPTSGTCSTSSRTTSSRCPRTTRRSPPRRRTARPPSKPAGRPRSTTSRCTTGSWPADLPADVREVFEQLKAASQNHLRAFTNQSARA